MVGRLNRGNALVTGAGNSVGRAVVKKLAAVGFEVWAADRSAERAQQVAANLPGADQARALTLDVTDENAWNATVQACVRVGGLQLLVNADSRFVAGGLEDTSQDDFNQQLTRNALGCWLGERSAIGVMADGGGAIINVTSVLAVAAAANCAAYCAAARGVLMSTKSAALECARDGLDIVVNAVLVGAIDDDDHFPGSEVLGGAPSVTPEEVAAAIVFLATDGGAYMTGTALPVDGGWLAQ